FAYSGAQTVTQIAGLEHLRTGKGQDSGEIVLAGAEQLAYRYNFLRLNHPNFFALIDGTYMVNLYSDVAGGVGTRKSTHLHTWEAMVQFGRRIAADSDMYFTIQFCHNFHTHLKRLVLSRQQTIHTGCQ